MDKILTRIYYDKSSPASYSGITKLWQEARRRMPKIKVKDVQAWLSRQRPYTLHKPIRRRFERRQTTVVGYGTFLSADLIDFSRLAKYNRNYRYILIVIEGLSRQAYVEPLKKKNAESTLTAFKRIYRRLPTVPFKLCSDDGKEFNNRLMKEFCKNNRIVQIISKNKPVKAWQAERFIRTIKAKLFRFLTDTNSRNWIDNIAQLVKSYNNTSHSSIGVAPSTVNLRNEESFIKKTHRRKRKGKYKLNDTVRIALEHTTFYKGYKQNYSDKLYSISQVISGSPPTYRVQDESGTEQQQLFYEPQLTLATLTPDEPRRSKYN